jgi:hypothetical protein
MKTCSTASLPHWLTKLSVLMLALYIQNAHAAYTVIDDDLMPTAPVEQATAPAHYIIPFYKEHSPLAHDGRTTLDTLIPQLRNATAIKIIGRPDARIYTQGKIANLASSRANNIRSYLTRAGVPYGIITIEVDNTPNPQANGNIYPCDLYIGATATTYNRAPAYAPISIDITTPRAAPRQTTQPTSNASSDQVVQFINRAVQSGQMAIEVALKLIRQLVESDNSNPQTQVAMNAPQRAPQYAAYQQQYSAPQIAAPVSAPIRVTQWVLVPEKTLKDNIIAWAATEGYTVEWQATNPYQLSGTSYVSGELLDSIDKVTSSIDLVMSASNKKRVIYISDKTRLSGK